MLKALYLKCLILFLPPGEGAINTNISYKRIVKIAKLKPSVILDGKFMFSF